MPKLFTSYMFEMVWRLSTIRVLKVTEYILNYGKPEVACEGSVRSYILVNIEVAGSSSFRENIILLRRWRKRRRWTTAISNSQKLAIKDRLSDTTTSRLSVVRYVCSCLYYRATDTEFNFFPIHYACNITNFTNESYNLLSVAL